MKEGSYLDIPLSDNPMVFGYRISQGAEENIQVFTGEFAAFQQGVCGEASGIRIIPQDEWEMHGYEIREYEGQRVLHNTFDYTEAKLKQRQQREQQIVEATPDTVGDLKAQIVKQQEQMNRMMNLMEKMSGNSPDVLKAEEAEAAAKQREAEELAVLADIEPEKDESVKKPVVQRKRPGPKPKQQAA